MGTPCSTSWSTTTRVVMTEHRLDGEVVDVPLDEAGVEQGEVRVERLDEENLDHPCVAELCLPAVVLPLREHPRRVLMRLVENRSEDPSHGAARQFTLNSTPRVAVVTRRVGLVWSSSPYSKT